MTLDHYDPDRGLEPYYGRRMSHAEAVLLCRYAKAACPQQSFDEYTPDAWGDLLSDLRFEDCKLAIAVVVKRQPFVAPAEIRAEVKRLRMHRLNQYGNIGAALDHVDPDDQRAYQRAHALSMRAVCDGVLTKDDPPHTFDDNDELVFVAAPELKPRDVASLGLAGREVPSS